MTASKDKGTRWESAVVAYLNDNGVRAYRPAQSGFKDHGDIHGVSPFVIQCKDWRDVMAALREGVDGAVVQAGHAGEDYGVAVIKRARRGVGEAYVVMRLEDWSRLLLELRAGTGA